MSANATEPIFLTPEEVSARYRGEISVKTLSNWRNKGEGPLFSKIGGKIFYQLDKLVAWEANRTVQSTSQYTAASHDKN